MRAYAAALLLPDQRREIIQPLASEHRRYRCFNVGTCELRRFSLTEFQRLRRCNDGCRGKCALGWSGDDGKREQLPPADLSVAAHVSSLGSTMTGPACSAPSSSDAPVCASLVRVAFAKSGPLLHARVTDTYQRSRLWTRARYPRTQRLCRRPPHPRWGHTADSAACRQSLQADTCPSGGTLERHTRERLPDSPCRHRLWTALLHENQGWSLVGSR